MRSTWAKHLDRIVNAPCCILRIGLTVQFLSMAGLWEVMSTVFFPITGFAGAFLRIWRHGGAGTFPLPTLILPRMSMTRLTVWQRIWRRILIWARLPEWPGFRSMHPAQSSAPPTKPREQTGFVRLPVPSARLKPYHGRQYHRGRSSGPHRVCGCHKFLDRQAKY